MGRQQQKYVYFLQRNVELITVELPGVVVHSVYKSPTERFVLPALGHRNSPHIVIGDFNSHNTTWGYPTTILEKRWNIGYGTTYSFQRTLQSEESELEEVCA